MLVVCEPEMIKEITVKSFQHFHDNDIEVDKKLDPVLGRNPFVLNGQEWKTVRGQLTPGFTSGKVNKNCFTKIHIPLRAKIIVFANF